MAPGNIYFSVSRSGLLYRIKFFKIIGFCPRCCCRNHTEQISVMVKFRRDNVNELGVGDTTISSITWLRVGAEWNKQGERNPPTLQILTFDVLTRETTFRSGRGGGLIKEFREMLTGSLRSLFLLFCSLAFSPLARFFCSSLLINSRAQRATPFRKMANRSSWHVLLVYIGW